MRVASIAVLACVGFGAAGCTEYFDRRETVSFHAGDAQQANLVTHVINPLPPHAANRHLIFDGERIGDAHERYREGRTTPLRTGNGRGGAAAAAGAGAAAAN